MSSGEYAKKKSANSTNEDDEIRDASLLEFANNKLDEIFISHIPVEDILNLPTKYKYFFGLFAELFVAVLLVIFIITGRFGFYNLPISF